MNDAINVCIMEARMAGRDRMADMAVAERDAMKAEIAGLRADKARLDWLADKDNPIGCVQLPTAIVEANVHSLRDAIDAAMKEGVR